MAPSLVLINSKCNCTQNREITIACLGQVVAGDTLDPQTLSVSVIERNLFLKRRVVFTVVAKVPFKFSFHSHCNLFPHSCCSCPRLWKGMNLKNFSTYLQVFFLLFYLYLNSSCENHFHSSLLLEELPAFFVSTNVVLIYSTFYMLFRTTLNGLFIAT